MTRPIAIIGPTHPFKGGIAQHTTMLAHRLVEAGADVEIVSWSSQYPKRLYPGELYVPEGRPEMEPFAKVERRLAWNRPWGWLREGRRLRGASLAVFVVASSFQVVPYVGILLALGPRTARRVALYHNVVPHEHRPFDGLLSRVMLRMTDDVIVHTPDEEREARRLGARSVVTRQLPPNLIVRRAAPRASRVQRGDSLRVLFFGLVREYKGLDVLLRAIVGVPQVTVTVAGEFWGGIEPWLQLVGELGLEGRVELRPGYVPADELPGLFSGADVVALPYRSATGSVNATLALDFGVPVISTRVGGLVDALGDGAYGALCEPDDVGALGAALEQACEPVVLHRWRRAVSDRQASWGDQWDPYVAAVLELRDRRPESR